MNDVYVVAAARSPVAAAGAELADFTVERLAAHAIAAAVERARVDPAAVDELRLGCADPWSMAGALDGVAAAAGLSNAATAIDAGGSLAGLATVIGASRAIRAGEADLVVACGVESMSRLGAEREAEASGPEGDAEAEVVKWSQSRWLAAHERRAFADEVVALGSVEHDDHPRADGAGDGAAALVLASGRVAADLKVQPMARVRGSASAAADPTAPERGVVHAVEGLLGRLGLRVDDVEVAEIDEPSPGQAALLYDALPLQRDRVNLNGGALAIGRPLGMSGARLAVALAHGLARRRAGHGLAATVGPDGAGQALALDGAASW